MLSRKNDAAMKLVRQADVKIDEKQFKEDMETNATKMAQAQAGLKAVLKIVKAENPGMIDAASAETASGQTRVATVLESMCADALKTDSTMTRVHLRICGYDSCQEPKT